MIAEVRIGNAARVFGVAAALGLSLALRDAVALQGTLLLAAVAALAIAADLSSALPRMWVVCAEAGLVALVVGMALPQGLILLPYLVVPALIIGFHGGVIPVVVTVGIELAALSTVVLTAGRIAQTETLSEIAGPWLLTTLGVGLLAARLRHSRAGAQSHDPSYESARRLLTQLRAVTRRLSSGLDAVTLATELLTTVHRDLEDTHAAVFTRTEGGVLAPLAYRGVSAKDALQAEGFLVETCWQSMEPESNIQATGMSDRRYRIVLPLRVGSRMLGVVVSESAGPPSAKAIQGLMHEIDDHALRLDAALAFDEIRSLATMQERHRLAREIHDGIAQEIASLGYVVDDLTADATSEQQLRKLGELRRELSRVVSELRLSIFDLRSEVSAGLGSALTDYVREVGSRSGITVHTTLDVAPTRLQGEVETELFRIAQEAITNARRHSNARNLWVDCRIRPPEARIEIRDDGRGLGNPRDDSYGIKVMRERAERINATLEITDQPLVDHASGTSVTVTVGVERAPHPGMLSAEGA